MDDARLEDKIHELVREFGQGVDPQHNPQDGLRHKLANPSEQMRTDCSKLEKSISNLQELLDYLRVCIKYQVFDLEATRRENEYLKKLLEQND